MPGEGVMPGAPDPMTRATEAMHRVALERSPSGEMPRGGMPEHEIEDSGDGQGGTA
jgi:hypothetical protein